MKKNKKRKPDATSMKGSSDKPFFGAARVFPKLTINAPNDGYEQQADAMADKVSKGVPPGASNASPSVQRSGEGGMAAPAGMSTRLRSRRGGGESLPSNTRQKMDRAFGTDFSGVRVHRDKEAAQMSQSIQAKAFTHGGDIYFNEGYYQPGSSGGDHLLAHELTHVVQQGAANGAPSVQRSTAGSAVGGVVGGLFGAGFGAGLGALIGGTTGAIVGGILGGLVGTVAGLIIGDSSTSGERQLNGPEERELRKVFGSSLDYSAIRLSFDAPVMTAGNYARTPGNTVYFPAATAVDAQNQTPGYFAFLVHEVTHAWQHQHGVSVMTKLVTAMGGSSAYDYGGEAGLRQALQDGKHFTDFNTEQQGDICSDYYRILTGQINGDISLYEPFIMEVKYGRTTPGPAGVPMTTDRDTAIV